MKILRFEKFRTVLYFTLKPNSIVEINCIGHYRLLIWTMPQSVYFIYYLWSFLCCNCQSKKTSMRPWLNCIWINSPDTRIITGRNSIFRKQFERLFGILPSDNTVTAANPIHQSVFMPLIQRTLWLPNLRGQISKPFFPQKSSITGKVHKLRHWWGNFITGNTTSCFDRSSIFRKTSRL